MSEVVEVPGTNDVVVMTDYLNEPGIHANLFRSRQSGERSQEVWRALPPGDAPDAWTEFEIQGETVHARSWSDFIVTLDLATGRELSRAFVGRP